MPLDYLLFDASDEEAGHCSFDALASAVPARLPALAGEVEAVLGWALREFGPPAGGADAGGWDFELQAWGGHEEPLEIGFDLSTARVAMASPKSGDRVTVALTLSGPAGFGAAFEEAFPPAD